MNKKLDLPSYSDIIIFLNKELNLSVVSDQAF